MNDVDIALICKALGDSNRLKIIQILSSGDKCGCDLLLTFNITQPTLSHHMKILSESNLINIKKDGKWCIYSINCDTLSSFKNYFGALTCSIDGGSL